MKTFTWTSGCSVLMCTDGFLAKAALEAFCPVTGSLLMCNAAAILCNKLSVLKSGPAAEIIKFDMVYDSKK